MQTTMLTMLRAMDTTESAKIWLNMGMEIFLNGLGITQVCCGRQQRSSSARMARFIVRLSLRWGVN